jgi:hypothetical protein
MAKKEEKETASFLILRIKMGSIPKRLVLPYPVTKILKNFLTLFYCNNSLML